jgi:microcystin-dependent protein
VCDGTNGTPDLVNRFPKGVGAAESAGATGGAASVNTGAGGNHDHGGVTALFTLTSAEVPTHTHRVRGADGPGTVVSRPNIADAGVYGLGGAAYSAGSPNPFYQQQTTGDSEDFLEAVGDGDPHDHDIAASGTHTHTVATMPPWCALWFLMRLP